jgi:hypothetical protein
MPRPYQLPGLLLTYGSAEPQLVRALQHDLRQLGYLEGAIDGWFGLRTEAALRALQRDLLHGARHDTAAPIRISDFNHAAGQPAVTEITGVLDPRLAACIDALLNDPHVEWLTRSNDPETANMAALRTAMSQRSWPAPRPFMLAILHQESRLRHFNVPSPEDADSFVVIGLERCDDTDPDHITARRYGMAQTRIAHHPPQPREVAELMADPVRHVTTAFTALRQIFDGMNRQPRLCRFTPDDPRYLNDCHNCTLAATWQDGRPDPAEFSCDWPAAMKTHRPSAPEAYQSRILLNLAEGARRQTSGADEPQGQRLGLTSSAAPHAARNRSAPPRNRPA